MCDVDEQIMKRRLAHVQRIKEELHCDDEEAEIIEAVLFELEKVWVDTNAIRK